MRLLTKDRILGIVGMGQFPAEGGMIPKRDGCEARSVELHARAGGSAAIREAIRFRRCRIFNGTATITNSPAAQ
jgi:hypothetical protein